MKVMLDVWNSYLLIRGTVYFVSIGFRILKNILYMSVIILRSNVDEISGHQQFIL